MTTAPAGSCDASNAYVTDSASDTLAVVARITPLVVGSMTPPSGMIEATKALPLTRNTCVSPSDPPGTAKDGGGVRNGSGVNESDAAGVARGVAVCGGGAVGTRVAVGVGVGGRVEVGAVVGVAGG